MFVLTNEVRDPWERPGGTTFYFVNDGIESALEQARGVAGDKDIRISGGANVIREYLDADRLALEYEGVIDSPMVTHLRYSVVTESTQSG